MALIKYYLAGAGPLNYRSDYTLRPDVGDPNYSAINPPDPVTSPADPRLVKALITDGQIIVGTTPSAPGEVLRYEDQSSWLQFVVVGNIDSPNLSTYTGAYAGSLLIVTQANANTNEYTLYAWDNANAAGADSPYVLAGSSGFWTAVAGKYQIGTRTQKGNLSVTGTGIFTGLIETTTLNTGQGANELYAMDQNVRTTDAPTFATLNTGQGANELYPMNQPVRTTDPPAFAGLTVTQPTVGNVVARFASVATNDDPAVNLLHYRSAVSSASLATIGTYTPDPLNGDKTLFVEAFIYARCTNGVDTLATGDGFAYIRRAMLILVGSTLTLVGSVQDGFTSESNGIADASLIVNGGNTALLIQGASGDASSSIVWHVELRVREVGT